MNKLNFSLAAALLLGVANAQAADFDSAATKANERLEAAQKEYADFLAEIGPQKTELATDLNLKEEKLRSLQRQFSEISQLTQSVDVEVSQLDQRISSLSSANSYIQSQLLTEYIRRLDLSLNPGERELYRDTIRSALEVTETEEGVEEDDKLIFSTQLKAINASISRIETQFGGSVISGSAIIDGEVLDGKFALVGPHVYFSAGGSKGGIVNGVRENTDEASVESLPLHVAAIDSLINGKQASIPVDTTGNSRSGALESIESDHANLTFREEFEAGGITMYAIDGLFILAILVSLYKFITLFTVRKAKESDLATVLSHLKKGDREAALAHAKGIGGPAGQLLTAAVNSSDESTEVIEEVLYEVIIKTQPKLDKLLAFIAVTAATAPLLGLLGTVTGMINTFKLITIVGTGDAKSLSSGISEALITTKWGLIVAIPTLISHALLNRKAKGVVGSLEQTAVGFVNGVAEMRESK